MTGILFFGVLIAWCVLCAKLAFSATFAEGLRQITRSSFINFVIRILVFAALLSLVIVDEIIGRYQFFSACGKYAVVEKMPEFRSDRIYSVKNERTNSIEGTVVPMTLLRSVAIDIEDGKPLFRYGMVDANGGWFIRLLGISNSDSPLLFPQRCDSRSKVREIKSKFNLKSNLD